MGRRRPLGFGHQRDHDGPYLARARRGLAGRVEVLENEAPHAVDDWLSAAARVSAQRPARQAPGDRLAVGGDRAVAVEIAMEHDVRRLGHRDRRERRSLGTEAGGANLSGEALERDPWALLRLGA